MEVGFLKLSLDTSSVGVFSDIRNLRLERADDVCKKDLRAKRLCRCSG